MKLQFFKEKETGDYGVIDIESFDNMKYEGRTSVIQGDPKSVATTMISNEFMAYHVKLVSEKYVPKVWRDALEGLNS